MIAHNLHTGSMSRELAAAIRTVNAAHNTIGGPELAGLKEAWVNLDRNLEVARAAGDDAAARRAVDTYQRDALAEIEAAA